MVTASYYPWLVLFLLGCYHGINPGMGWLFAVALGLQERSTAAVLRAIVPLGIGHVASVAIVVLVAVSAAVEFPHVVVHTVAAAILIAFGAYRLFRTRHPRWVGMRVGFWGLATWGFLMSTAHGAGLMLVPFVTARPMPMRSPMSMPLTPAFANGWQMIGVHTFGYLVAMTAVALVVYRSVGVSFLRKAWINLDLLWAAVLFATGIIALLT
jgi:uncharacterized membrane protein (UPF0136 family)